MAFSSNRRTRVTRGHHQTTTCHAPSLRDHTCKL